jgi:AcrR family transcriptional regulator
VAQRDPFETRVVTSRRGGPVKQPLSRDAIVTAALGLITSAGLEGMSLRKVASALDTGPASLYAYVDNLQELQALVLDRALLGVKTKGPWPGRDWRGRVGALLGSYLKVLSARPGLAQLALSTIAVGPNAMRISETLLGLLAEGGVARATAAWAVDLLLLYCTAIAAEKGQLHDGPDPLERVGRAVATLSPEEYPHIFAARQELLSGTGNERGAWAVAVLLNGILRTPRRRGEKRSRTRGTSK